MKRSSIVSQVIGPVIVLAMIGCSGPTDTVQTEPATTDVTRTDATASETTSSDTVPGDGEAVTLVSLKVPNMH